ncbi:helix-turn-helix domain-containing protein [Flavobacterium sp. UBA6135]|uniref:helix-turn-helix domain-containing protein n=1 Tax=Flavobacterium sp. UBA6135 TaxID=1946553 RepID=UPI0025C586CE|nr:helix-turn-helix transcriptional regulator [Flavobacterium sp. UBA6135]
MTISIGNKLKKLRKNKGYSQEEVANLLHNSQSTYARIENGESHSSANHIVKICEVYEITPEELIKSDSVVIGNIGTNNGVGYAEVVNQLSEKLIEQYELRLKEKDEQIKNLKTQIEK